MPLIRSLCLLLCLAATAHAQDSDSAFVRAQYTKFEYQIPMRDGVNLFTIVYVPKDASDGNRYPILLQRTPYSVAPYGPDKYRNFVSPNPFLMRDKYIVAYQDMRGRYMSEGKFEMVRPLLADSVKARNPKATDEASDTYDTIAWLLAHIPSNNGRVGQWGISFPGGLASMGAVSRHPALVASSPQAPVTDSYFEDFHHNGALTQGYFYAYPIFGVDRPGPTSEDWWLPHMVQDGLPDDYAFQLALGPLKTTTAKYYPNDRLWRDVIIAHPNYDTYWQSRAVPPRLTGIHHAVMVVGGWFDAENLYGALKTYKTIKAQDPDAKVSIVMGPFRHGGWEAHHVVHTVHGDIYFGDSLETKFQRDVEAPFFHANLKGDGKTDLPEALMFDTGRKNWRSFSRWPAPDATARRYYFQTDGALTSRAPTAAHARLSYVSDPAKPVPSRCIVPTIEEFTMYQYMSDDQRCDRSREDVLTFETGPLTQDVTLGGEIWARLQVSTTGTDADYVVKLIDVYPPNEPDSPYEPNSNIHYGGYEQLVRGEIMRARYRKSFVTPEPMKPGEITPVSFRLQDVLHTFRAGHRIMVQVQSSWFPAFDRNPQHYVPSIYQAGASDFVKATQSLWMDRQEPSYLEVQVVP